MSYNGSGTFVINTAGQPVVSGTVISSTAFNALTADLATGLSTAITKDGQTTPTANIPMGNNKITNLAVGTAATDAANLSQVQSTTAKLINSISGADTITGTMSPNLAAYATGQMFYFIAAGDNTGAVTLNIDSLGAKAVTRDGSVALAAGDIKSGEVVVVVYDGTRFQVVSQINSSGNATFANVSITSALNVGGVATFSAGTAAAPSITTSGDTNNGIFFPATDVTAITTAGSERLRVDASGNLGLGVTPDGNNLAKTFELQQGFTMFGFSNTSYLSANAYYNSGWKYKSTAAAAYYEMSGANGHKWSVAASGTAGNAITFFESMKLDTGGLNVATSTGNCYVYSARASKSTGQVAFQLSGGTSGTDWIIYQPTNSDNLTFFGNSGDRMTLDTSGNLGVGTTSPGFRLDVQGSTGFVAAAFKSSYATVGYIGSDTSTVWFGAGGSAQQNNAFVVHPGSNYLAFYTNAANERARITAGGTLLVNCTTAAANALFEVSSNGTKKSFQVYDNDNVQLYALGTGTVYSNGGVLTNTNPSDERLKDDIADLAYGLEQVLALRPVSYKWKNDRVNQGTQYGFIAQEVQSVMPELVREFDAVEDEEPVKRYGLEKDGIYAALVKAVQEQQAMIEELKAKVSALEAK